VPLLLYAAKETKSVGFVSFVVAPSDPLLVGAVVPAAMRTAVVATGTFAVTAEIPLGQLCQR
jgi:hypothetical protein